jgi:type I restriction enzyme S subunit
MHGAKTLVGYKLYHPGQIVMNRMQAWSGMFGARDLPGLVSSDYSVFQIVGDHHVRFLLYRLKSPDLVGRFAIESKGIGSGFNRLYTDRFGPIPITFPAPDEQAAIVRFLDHLNHRLERAIRAKKELIALLNEQKQAIIHRAVTRGLDPDIRLKPSGILWMGDVPANWQLKRIAHVASILTGYPFPSTGFSQSGKDVRLLRGINVTPGAIRWGDVVRWPERGAGQMNEFRLRVGDIVLGMDRPIVRGGIRVAVLTDEDVPSLLLQRVARLRPFEGVHRDFLALLLSGKCFLDYLAPIFTGVSVPHISPHQIGGYKCAFPSHDEQSGIVDWIAEHTSSLNTAIERAQCEIDLIREYRTRISADVVTGQLDVREVSRTLPAEIDATEPSVDTVDEDESEELLEAVADNE